MEALLTNVGLSLVFAILGFVLLCASYWVIDKLTPGELNHRIFDEGNTAAAILAAGFVIGLAIIIAAAIA